MGAQEAEGWLGAALSQQQNQMVYLTVLQQLMECEGSDLAASQGVLPRFDGHTHDHELLRTQM